MKSNYLYIFWCKPALSALLFINLVTNMYACFFARFRYHKKRIPESICFHSVPIERRIMQVCHEKFPLSLPDPQNADLFAEQTVLLDIETTGLKPAYCWIYLVGTIRRGDGHLLLTQHIAETQEEEAALLRTLLQELDAFSCRRILSWRGDRFDLPFIQERCRTHELFFDPAAYESVDLFETSKLLPRIYPTADRGLWATADLFGRAHPAGRPALGWGREKVGMHREYLKTKDPALLETLRLANRENLLDTLACLPLKTCERLLDAKVSVQRAAIDGSDLLFEAALAFSVPVSFRLSCSGAYLIVNGSRVKGSLRVRTGRFYYELPDPSKYVYVTDEGVLLPKALAKTVDASRRRKATREDCRVFLETSCVQVDPSYVFRDGYRPLHAADGDDGALYMTVPGADRLAPYLEDLLPQLLRDAVKKRIL